MENSWENPGKVKMIIIITDLKLLKYKRLMIFVNKNQRLKYPKGCNFERLFYQFNFPSYIIHSVIIVKSEVLEA
jgi:hypothetical protein